MKWKEMLSLSVVDNIVKFELRINIDDDSVKSRIQNLFVSIHLLSQQHDIAWILTDNQKISVNHVLPVI